MKVVYRHRQHSMGKRARPESAQQGASLLELLVAILLVSLGLLGIAGLAGATYSQNKTAQIRLVGLALVSEYADRARANIYGVDLGAYDIALDDSKPSAPTYSSTEANETDQEAAAGTVAEGDQYDFFNEVESRLPGGKPLVVSTTKASERSFDVWLLWKEPANANDDIFKANQDNCPSSLTADQQKVYSCMYFKVGL